MPKIVMFSDLFLPTFPYLEIPMYNYLKDKGIDVVYALQEGDIRLTDEKLYETFGKLNLLVLKKPKHLVSTMKEGDVLLMRFAYKIVGGDVAHRVRAAGYKILMYDPSGIDIRVRQCPAQYLTAKSELLKKATLAKFPRAYKDIYVVGTIHNDLSAVTEVDRTEFMKSYGMDPNKKFALITPANPGDLGFHKKIDTEYTQIVRIIKEQCPNYEFAVKAHPYDYMASMKVQPGILQKNVHYGGKHSWEKFAPGITVIKAEEGYKAIKASDVILNVRSSIAMEAVYFNKPVLFINRKKYTVNWPFDPKIMTDIEMKDLANRLNTNNYGVDPKACLEYIKRESFSDDGKAYARTADLAIQILEGKI
jgi:hypothetical protein